MNKILKQVLFLLGFVFIALGVRAQDRALDSLKNELIIHKKRDTIRVNLLNEAAFLAYKTDDESTKNYIEESAAIANSIAFKAGVAKSFFIKGLSETFHSNYTKGFDNYEEALQLYLELNYKNGMAQCYRNIGLYFYKNGKQKEAIKNYKKSLNVYEEFKDREEMFIDLNNIGWSLLQLGDYDEAIKSYKRALEINKETKNKTLLTYCFSDLGVIYTYQGNYPLALSYFKKALNVGEESADSISMGNTLGNMGPVYNHLGNYEKAIECYKKSNQFLNNTNKEATASNLNNLGLAYIDLMEYNNAFEYLEGALKIYKEINNKVNEALTLNNIGYTHLKLKKYEDAYLYYEKAKKINLEVENKRGLCTSYLGIARMYTNQKKYDNALVYALKSEKIADELDMIKFKRDASELLSKIYNNTNDYKKAFTSHQQFKILNDSLFNKNNIEKIAQLEYEYKYKQALDSASIRELQLTKTVKTTSENLEKTQRNLLLGVIGFLLIALLMGAIIFIQKLRNVQTKTQNIIVEQKLLRSQMTPHFIFNSLSVLQGMILNKEEKTSVSYLAKFSKLLRTILENSRHKTVVLSEELSAIDSYMALQNLDVTPPFKYKLTIDPKIDKSALKIPPMLIQPFIENAIEHAFPNKKENKEISIDLTFVDNKLVCKVLDNGVGINIENKTANRNKSSLATKITAERLQMLSKEFSTEGSVTIQNRKEFGKQGTLVTLVIPYKN